MTDEQANQDVQKAPVRRRIGPRHGVRIAAILLAAPVVFALIAAAMMIDRDITAPSWIVKRVEQRAALMLGGGSLGFGAVTVNVGRDLHPRLRLREVELRDASGARLAQVAQVTGLLSPRGLVFERAALMQEVTLSGAQIALRRAADGSVALAFDIDAAAARTAPSLPGLLDQVDRTFDRPALAALEQVAVDGLIINYADARAGRNWTVDGGRALLDLRDGQSRLQGEAFLLSGGSVTEMTLDYASPRGSSAADLTIVVTDARATDVATQSPAFSWLAAIDAPLSARLETSLDTAGALGALAVSLDLGTGALRPPGGAAALAFDAITANLTYDPAQDRIGFDDLTIVSEWGRLSGRGQALARDITDGLPGTLLGQFTLHDVGLNPMSLYPQALPITDAAVDLRLRLDPFQVEIGQAIFSSADFALVTRGKVKAQPDGWDIALDMQTDEIAVNAVKALWPESLIPGARRWFAANVHQGQLRGLSAGFRRRPGAAPQLAAGFGFADTELTFIRTMPQVKAARGVASLVEDRFVVAVDGADLTAPQGGKIQLAGSVLTIPDTRAKPARPEFQLNSQSTITAALALLDLPPFEVMTKAGRPVTLADGVAQARGQISWPAVPKDRRTPGDTTFDVTADLTRLRSDQVIPDRLLTAARANLSVDNAGLVISGAVTVDGVPVTGRWSRGFGPESAGQSEVVASVELSPRFLDAFGIGLPQGSVSGRGTGDLVLNLTPDAPPDFTLVSDLRGVGLSSAQLGWSKPASDRGNLLVAGSLGAPPRIDRLEVAGGGLEVAGRVTLTDQGTLAAATFDKVRLGNWLNAPMTLRGRGAGLPIGVEIGGGTVDLRAAQFGASGGDSGPSEIALDRLQITDGIALDGFRGNFNGQGGFSGQFRGRVNAGPMIQGTVVPENGRSAIRLISDDAGGVASAAGLIRNAVGGSLDLTLRPTTAEGTFDGTLAVRALRIRDAPAIAALLDAISVVGLLQQLDGQGLSFDEVDARFQLTPRAVVIQEASAVGPGLGISLDGLYTLASKELDLQGVISPLYLINSIGAILTRKGEGLIGFNYAVGGTADAPRVSVNPLSALTPGMFREIFRKPVPEVTQ